MLKIFRNFLHNFFQFESAYESAMKGAFKGETDKIEIFLKKGGDINRKDSAGYTLLMEASLGGHAETVRYLLKNGANPNSKDNNGYDALSGAADVSNFECGEILIENGANIHSVSNFGETTLMAAAGADYPSPEFIENLCQKGAKVNLIDEEGDSALIYAINYMPNEKIVKVLLANGADKKIKNKNGETSLDIHKKNAPEGDEDYIEEYLRVLELLK